MASPQNAGLTITILPAYPGKQGNQVGYQAQAAMSP